MTKDISICRGKVHRSDVQELTAMSSRLPAKQSEGGSDIPTTWEAVLTTGFISS